MNYNLKEIIHVPLQQAVLDNFSNTTGMASIAVTSDGNYITNLHKVVCSL